MKSGSSKQTTTTKVVVPPWLDAPNQDLISRATALSNQPYQPYEGERIAPFSSDQLQAFQSVRDIQGKYNPLLDQSSAGVGALFRRAEGPSSEDVQRYMNPFLENVLNSAKVQEIEQAQRDRQSADRASAISGAFGGSRNAVERALNLEQSRRRLSDLDYRGRYDAFQNALGQYNQDSSVLSEAIGRGINVAQTGQQSDLAGINALLQTGGQQQTLDQMGKDIDYSNFVEERSYPYEQTQYLQGFLQPYTQLYAGQEQTVRSKGGGGSGLGKALGTLGTIASFIPGGQAIGAGLQMAGAAADGNPMGMLTSLAGTGIASGLGNLAGGLGFTGTANNFLSAASSPYRYGATPGGTARLPIGQKPTFANGGPVKIEPKRKKNGTLDLGSGRKVGDPFRKNYVSGGAIYEPIINEYANYFGISPEIMYNQIGRESSFNPFAKGDLNLKGGPSLGLAQFRPDTAASLNINPLDPRSAIKGQATYLDQLLKRFDGDMKKALAAYNWGQGNLSRLIEKHGDNWYSKLPKPVQEYVRKIMPPAPGVKPLRNSKIDRDIATLEDSRALEMAGYKGLNSAGNEIPQSDVERLFGKGPTTEDINVEDTSFLAKAQGVSDDLLAAMGAVPRTLFDTFTSPEAQGVSDDLFATMSQLPQQIIKNMPRLLAVPSVSSNGAKPIAATPSVAVAPSRYNYTEVAKEAPAEVPAQSEVASNPPQPTPETNASAQDSSLPITEQFMRKLVESQAPDPNNRTVRMFGQEVNVNMPLLRAGAAMLSNKGDFFEQLGAGADAFAGQVDKRDGEDAAELERLKAASEAEQALAHRKYLYDLMKVQYSKVPGSGIDEMIKLLEVRKRINEIEANERFNGAL